MIKVAVIVPVFNVQNYLNECLDSLINQTLKDIAIILVNDGSTDTSLDILNQYKEKDSRIIVIDKKNSGYGDSMNVGIAKAIDIGAQYIAFADPDDYLALDGYEKLYNIAKTYDIDVLRANITSVITEKDGSVTYFKNDSLRAMPEYYNKVLSLRENKQLFTMNSNCGGLFSTDFIHKNILHNTTPGASYQDTGFWFQCYCLSERFYFCQDRYYFYRRDREGSSENGKKDQDIIFKEYDFIEKFLKRKNLFEEFRLQYFAAKYRSLYWYFHLLTPSKRPDYILKVSNSFNKEIKARRLNVREAKSISPYLYMIIKNPDEFLKVKEEEEKNKEHSPLIQPK